MKPIVGDIITIKKMLGFNIKVYKFRIDSMDEQVMAYGPEGYSRYICQATPLDRRTTAELQARGVYDHAGYIEFESDEIVTIDLHNRVKIRLNHNPHKTSPNPESPQRGQTVFEWEQLFDDLRRWLRPPHTD